MGLINWAMKLIFASSSIVFACLALSIGLQRSSFEKELINSSFLPKPLIADEMRAQLVQSVQLGKTESNSLLIEKLAKRIPVDPVVFEVALNLAVSEGDSTRADILARDVLLRQPRSLAARLYLFASAARNRDFGSLIYEYERLLQVRSIEHNTLTRALIGVFREEGNWGELSRYITDTPAVGETILIQLIYEAAPNDVVRPLVSSFPRAQEVYFQVLVEQGLYEDAYRAWLESAQLSGQAPTELPFNSTFSVLPDPPPFNWQVQRGLAEFQSHGGIYIVFLGTGRPLIAKQLLAIAPGSYSLVTEANGRMPENAGSLEWELNCLPEDRTIFRGKLTLRRIDEEESIEHRLSIPRIDCEFQWLKLHGLSGEIPQRSQIEITRVRFKPMRE